MAVKFAFKQDAIASALILTNSCNSFVQLYHYKTKLCPSKNKASLSTISIIEIICN